VRWRCRCATAASGSRVDRFRIERSAPGRRVKLELKWRGLERFAGRPWASALGPVRADVVGAAASVADAAVERLNRQASGVVAGDERVEPPPQPVDLDDVADLDPLEPHRPEG
jgi:hypothetical protein